MVTSGRSYGCMPEKRSVARRATSDQWICCAGWRAMAQGLRCDYLSSTPDINGAKFPSSFEGFGVFLRSFSTKYDWNTAHRCPIALRTTMNCDPNRVDVSSLEETYNDLLDVWSSEGRDYSSLSDYLTADSVLVSAIGLLHPRREIGFSWCFGFSWRLLAWSPSQFVRRYEGR